MNATTLSQQFTHASYMQMLQHSPILIPKNNYHLNIYPFIT